MNAKAIDVVAGIIFNEDQSQVLLSLRKPEQHQGNCWEFPGGKIEANESHEQALIRELNEELGIQVLTSEAFCHIQHDYSDKSVHLHFWQVLAFSGKPIGQENQKLAWYDISALSQLTFPEANKPVVQKLIELLNC